MTCQRCGSTRVAEICAKCSDCCGFGIGEYDHRGYVPHGCGVGDGDDVEFHYCLDCGQIQGEFPLPATEGELS